MNMDVKINKFDPIRRDPITGEKVQGFPGVWRYSKIKEAQGVTAVPLPDEYIVPWVKDLFPRSQGMTGTCVGQSMAYCMDMIYLKLTGDIPTAEDKAKAKRDVKVPIGPYITNVDQGYPQSFSAACAYHESRKLGNVTVPEGSFIDYAILASLKIGMCRDYQWYNSKDGKTEWDFPYPDVDPITGEKAFDTAANHKIDGYAQCTSPESIKRAIFDHQWGVESAWEVFENYAQGQSDGHWPSPRGESVGGHAMAIVGWTKSGDWIVLQSWFDQGWPLLNYLPSSYWSAFIGAIVPLDSTEAKFGRGVLYQKVPITCSDEANVTVNDKFIGKGKSFSVDLEIGVTATISASATGWQELIGMKINVTADTPAVNIVFKNKPAPPVDPPVDPPTPPTPPTPKPGTAQWVKDLQARMKAIADAIKKKFQKS